MPATTRRFAWLTLPILALGLSACGDDDPTGVEPEPALSFQTSFEQGSAGFSPDTTDMGNPPVEWSVERVTDLADDGTSSMRIRIDNLNDQAKVWIERVFEDLDPNTTYQVELSFDFATADWGDVNLWTLFADVDAESPEVWSDFDGDAYTTNTGNDADENTGYVWETHTAELTVETDGEGTLHAAIGVWGTYEVERTYYIDSVEIVVTDG